MTIIIFIFVIISMIFLILFKPKITINNFTFQTFYLPCVIGAILLIIFNKININYYVNLFDFSLSVNPIKILILFISLSFISINLDQGGFFEYCANKVLKKSSNPLIFFLLLYLIVSTLTIFTSNDIVILTFTPFICYYCKGQKLNPLPYLITEFVGANTWSMMLEISNPTNIYLCLSKGINFNHYINVMILPTLTVGISSLIIILLIFHKSIFKKNHQESNIISFKKNNYIIITSLLHLIICLIGLIVFNDYMYLVCLVSMISLVIFTLIYDLKTHNNYLKKTFFKLPFAMIPFILSMYFIVASLNSNSLSSLLINLSNNNITTSLVYGYASLFTSNLINNIPMCILFSNILNNNEIAIFSSIMGSNIGALLTPIGALAGIMWMSLLKEKRIEMNFFKFIKYCAPICLISSFLGFIVLAFYF